MIYKKITGTYAGSNGESRIYYYEYIPECEPIGVLQIAHGMCEYLERYQSMIEWFLNRGFIVVGNDHLGHGRTAAPDPENLENLGYLGEEGWKAMVEDLHRLVVAMHKKYKDLPYYLLGHSMGSFLTRAYIAKYGEELDGVIISGTAGTLPVVKEALLYVKQLIKKHGCRYRSEKVSQIMFGVYNRRIQNPVNGYAWLSRDPAVAEAFAGNPYSNYTFTLDGFYNLLSLLRYISTASCYRAADPHIPMLIISGEEDPVGAYGKGVREVAKRYQKEEWPDLTLKLYPGMRHEMMNEKGREAFFEDVFNWLQGNEI